MVTYEQSRQKVFQEYAEKKKASKKLYKYLKNSGKNASGLDLFHTAMNLKGPSFGEDLWDFSLKDTDKKGNREFNMRFSPTTRRINTIWELSEMEKKRWQII